MLKIGNKEYPTGAKRKYLSLMKINARELVLFNWLQAWERNLNEPHLACGNVCEEFGGEMERENSAVSIAHVKTSSE